MSSPTTTFSLFPLLPTELRRQIFLSTLPTLTTLHITEGADLDVTLITPHAPAAHMTCKEAQQMYVEGGYTPYSVYAMEDWTAIHLAKDSALQLVISPSSSPKANLNVTWTELRGLLGDALLAVKTLHIVCNRPVCLVRLWATPEAGLVKAGASHWDEDLWCKETVASDRECRALMHPELKVTTSVATLEELERGIDDVVEERELVKERAVEGFGAEAKFSDTKFLRLLEESCEIVSQQRKVVP
ncbi:hypothetical protein DE146DRAFT_674847 [Phaeosphaeria sp. MPI-PUGE-AT-0046c]|nr:hypothetical protein DE146DRAFT_674847 [Phaeosphaeria sp. MPI-PUGE-AT-0046c]